MRRACTDAQTNHKMALASLHVAHSTLVHLYICFVSLYICYACNAPQTSKLIISAVMLITALDAL